MAYLDNTSITVDAILTRKGREKLAKEGRLNITHFALADDEIDYRLYDPNHPKGAAFADIAIRNTPIFEPLTDETQVLKYKLVTLNEGVSSIPIVSIAQDKIVVNRDYTGEIIISPSTNPSYDVSFGYTAVLGNKTVGTLIVDEAVPGVDNSSTLTVPTFIGDVNVVGSQVVVGKKFRFIPNSQISETTTTTLTIIGNESGAMVSIEVTVIRKSE